MLGQRTLIEKWVFLGEVDEVGTVVHGDEYAGEVVMLYGRNTTSHQTLLRDTAIEYEIARL